MLEGCKIRETELIHGKVRKKLKKNSTEQREFSQQPLKIEKPAIDSTTFHKAIPAHMGSLFIKAHFDAITIDSRTN